MKKNLSYAPGDIVRTEQLLQMIECMYSSSSKLIICETLNQKAFKALYSKNEGMTMKQCFLPE